MKYVLFYDAAADMDRAREVFPAHRAKWQEFVARGELLMIGPFSDPRQGAMGVFSTREAAEESCAWTVPSGGRGEEVGAARVERGDCFVSGESYSPSWKAYAANCEADVTRLSGQHAELFLSAGRRPQNTEHEAARATTHDLGRDAAEAERAMAGTDSNASRAQAAQLNGKGEVCALSASILAHNLAHPPGRHTSAT